MRLQRSHIVIADWADAGAAWASRNVAPGTRLIVRAHSIDLLQPWMALVNWARVDQAIFVSRHAQSLGERFELGEITEQRVIPNLVHLNHFALPKELDARFTLVLIGWARRVKDPLWALEVLSLLVEQDSRFRLLLVGDDFPETGPVSGADYRCAYRNSALRASLSDHVEELGYTNDVAEVLQRVGFVLSSSRREGFSIALLEGMASGAVPVVRDWPIYAPLGAAAGIFGKENVAKTPQEAAALILERSQPEAWQAASRDAQESAQQIAEPRGTAATIRAVVGQA